MQFNGIGQFLEKYRKYFSDNEEERKIICAIIARTANVHLSEDEFIVLRGELLIKGDSVLKNELFIHKEQILSELHKNGLTHISGIK